MRRILVLLVSMMLMVCTSASANIVYLTSSGAMGVISTSGSDTTELIGTKYTVSWNNPLLGSYWNGSSTNIILVDRTTDLTTSGDTALIFSPLDLTRPINSTRRVLAGVYSANAIAGSERGRSVFFASDSSIYELSTENFSLTRFYTYIPNSIEDIDAEITELITGSNVIYALVKQDISRDVVLRFDGQLRDDVSGSFINRPLAYGAETISWLSGSRVAAGHVQGVDVWQDDRGFRPVLSTDIPVKAVCQDSGNGFYFIEQDESEGVYTTTLNHYSYGEGMISMLYTTTEGRTCRLLRDRSSGIVSAIVGDKILLYKMNRDTLIGEYDSSELGGVPVQIALTSVPGDNGSNSSGCSLSGIGMMMIFLAGVIVSRKK